MSVWLSSFLQIYETDNSVEVVKDDDLQEVFVSGEEESEEKISHAAHQIFGNDYNLIAAEIENNKKQNAWYKEASHGLLRCTCLSMFVVIGCTFGKIVIPGYIFTGISVSLAALSGGVHVKAKIEKKLGDNKELILSICDSLLSLSQNFEAFKKNPSEDLVKDLFLCLNNVRYLEGTTKMLSKTEIELLSSLSYVFLMDAVAKILKENLIDSSLPGNWEKLLTHVKDIPENEELDFNNEEPWKQFDIHSPNCSAYIKFFRLEKQIESLKIVEEMIAIFDKVVKNPEAIERSLCCFTI